MKPPKIHPNSIIPLYAVETLTKVDAALLDLFMDPQLEFLKSKDPDSWRSEVTKSYEAEDLISHVLYNHLKDRLDRPAIMADNHYKGSRWPAPTIDYAIYSPVRVCLQFLMFYGDTEGYKTDSVRMKNTLDLKAAPGTIGVQAHINFRQNGLNPAEQMLRDRAAVLSRKYWRHVSIIPESQDPSFVRLVYGIRSRETFSSLGSSPNELCATVDG